MDTQEIKNRYIAEYNKLADQNEIKKIDSLIDEINLAISKPNTKDINDIYSRISEWNERVSNLQGARVALNAQHPSLHLPSAAQFLIIFDNFIKEWRFNTQPD